MRTILRPLALGSAFAVTLALAVAAPDAMASEWPASDTPPSAKPTLVHDDLALPDGRTADVYTNGLAVITNAADGTTEDRMLPAYDVVTTPSGQQLTADEAQVQVDLAKPAPTQARPDRVEVVLAGGVHPAGRAAPNYTSDAALNKTLARVGATRMTRLFPSLPAGAPAQLVNAYVVELAQPRAATAVPDLLAAPELAYAAPAWTVTPMNVAPKPIPAAELRRAQADATRDAPTQNPAAQDDGLPTNYALSASMQSLLNRPGIDWTEAQQVLQQRYGQLPGAGEIITNVSVGDLVDSNLPTGDPCASSVRFYGPTTVVDGGQRYLDLPSLPLIPTYTAGLDGSVDPTGTSCYQDPLDSEIDLDFAMMAGLPHDKQRAGAVGSGYTDLLGVAPGADYRLVVPDGADAVDLTGIDAALLAAAQQNPRPNVITASLGLGFDTMGVASRYLEDDPLTQTLVSFIVHYYKIVVCISAGDGLRQFTSAPYGPSGGSVPTNLPGPGHPPTDVGDVYLSDSPSVVADSGAIDVGGTTLDDIFSAPPQHSRNAALAAQHAFPIVRYNGELSFSSGFGSRVNVSAPGDNVISFQHTTRGQAGDVDSVISGGTSASAPIVAAAAAVVQQTARLVGDTTLATDPLKIRSWLRSTAAPVPNVPQADQPIDVGPQVDIGAAVARLVSTRTGSGLAPGVGRVAVEQRRPYDIFNRAFLGDTDPNAISLAGDAQQAWITIAPDWLGSAAQPGARYALTIGGTTLATTPYARLSPRQLFAAAGQAFPPAASTTMTLTYTARAAGGVRVSTDVTFGFGPASGGLTPLAPDVPPVVSGDTMTVRYDLSDFAGVDHPVLVVSEPGRAGAWDTGWRIAYQQVLDQDSGTVQVPVAALPGGGMYGVSIQQGLTINQFANWAITRVRGARTDDRPAVPTLNGGHGVDLPYGGSVTVRWDVRDVAGASGARLEVSAPGPVAPYTYATFNNPNGTVRDANGLDTGSVYDEALPGTHGSITLAADRLGLVAGAYQQVRVRSVDRQGNAAGPASGSAMAHRFGITTSDHMPLVAFPGMGFGVDQHGTGGILSSATALVGRGEAAMTQFDQRTATIARTLDQATYGHEISVLNAAGPGVFTGHVGLYQDVDVAANTARYRTVDLATGQQRDWTPPAGYLLSATAPFAAADNQTAAGTAFVTGLGGNASTWRLFTSDVAAGTFGPAYSLADAIAGLGASPFLEGIAQDPIANKAYVYVQDSPSLGLIEVDLATGSTRTITLPGTCFGNEIAVNPAAHTALLGGSQQMCLVDLVTGTAKRLDDGGFGHDWLRFDSTRGEFVLTEFTGPEWGKIPNPHAPGNIWARTINNNTMANVRVLDAQGRLLRRASAAPNYNGIIVRATGALMDLNPATGTGYVLGPDGVSLQPFPYGD